MKLLKQLLIKLVAVLFPPVEPPPVPPVTYRVRRTKSQETKNGKKTEKTN